MNTMSTTRNTALEVPSNVTDPLMRSLLEELIRKIEDLEARLRAVE